MIQIDEEYQILPDKYGCKLVKTVVPAYSERLLKAMETRGVKPSNEERQEIVGYYADLEDALRGYLRVAELDKISDLTLDMKGILKELEDIHKTIRKVSRCKTTY